MTYVSRSGQRRPFSEMELMQLFKNANNLEDGVDDGELEDPAIAAIACYQAGMFHPERDSERDSEREKDADDADAGGHGAAEGEGEATAAGGGAGGQVGGEVSGELGGQVSGGNFETDADDSAG
mmetsp:Transcript_3707/g.8730  ORF Transcript_3707/g.8730 Transcript_3707/m.8730 type:complete len:124 (+) Transcript_3707:274-645(+)